MEPPPDVIKALHRIDPSVRLGWGPPPRPQHPVKDWPAKIAFIILVPPRQTSDVVIGDPWNDRGPIYGCPFDRLFDVPVAIAFYDPAEISWSEIVNAARDRKQPNRIVHAITTSAREYAKEVHDDNEDLAGQMGEELYWRAQRSDAASPEPVPKKHLTKEEREVLSGTHETQKPLTDIYDDGIPK